MFFIEFDGFDVCKVVYVIGVINCLDMIDFVMVWFGCFDKFFYVDLFLFFECFEIFKIYIKKMLINEDLW